MKVSDLLYFSKEKYFNGAVQTEWYYNKVRLKEVAESYVFHGPKYYGVSEGDYALKNRPVDTASYTKIIAEKIYNKSHGSNFLMTVAGYGTGKSHLAVCLGALFSGNNDSKTVITSNLCKADKDIGSYIERINTKKNFILVLNGMNNFNLDAEFLRCARLSLAEYGLDDSVLRGLTKSYDVAKHFVDKMFSLLEDSFVLEAEKIDIQLTGNRLKQFIIDNIESNSQVLSLVNKIYKDVNGDNLHWERGVSAGEVLTIISQELCGEGKPFNKLVVFFDEFGRYIEYTAANPLIAGDASFQQIFEATQNADGNIIFIGLIQKELKTYTLCIDKTSNFIRYIDRFKSSEEVYLSCNFETILANLIQKRDEDAYDRIVKYSYTKYYRFHNNLHSALNRWDRNQYKKSVWSNKKLYDNTILEGCYPLHPFTVWFLSNSTNMLQQRSAITFASEMFDSVSSQEIKGAWLPYVYPVDIIDSGLYYDILSSEESGNTQSQYCMLYRDIMTKCHDKLSIPETQVLKAILICNLSRFRFRDKNDAVQAIDYCTDLKPDEISEALNSLETLHGVISFDENNLMFDLIAEANGLNEFKRVFNRYYISTPSATIDDCDEVTRKSIGLDRMVETSFAQEHHISSLEWSFKKVLVAIEKIDKSYLSNIIRKEYSDLSGTTPRGTLLYAYCSNVTPHLERIKDIYNSLNADNHPLIILLVEDSSEEILKALRFKMAISRFSSADYQKFEKFISSLLKEKNKKITTTFTQLISQRQMINSDGLAIYQTRINLLCTDKFNQLYYSAPPFSFDGFENKTSTPAKKSLANICIKLFDRSLMNIQSYQALTQPEINRIKSSISVGTTTSWEMFDANCNLVEPRNELILSIFNTITSKLSEDSLAPFHSIFKDLSVPPYGMNENSLALLFICYIVYKGNEILVYYGEEKLTSAILSKKIFKDYKLQYKEFSNIKLQINANADKDYVAELCNRILSNTLVENCAKYKENLTALLASEGSLPQDQLLIADAQARNDDGLRLYKKIYEDLSKAQAIIEENQRKFIIHKFVKVFSYIADIDKPIEEGLPFVFSVNYKQKVAEIQRSIDSIIKSKYEPELQKLSCSIKQLGQLKSIYKNVIKVLDKNGYKELAKKTEDRLVELERELDAKQKYETSLVECNKDIAFYSDSSFFTYSQAVSAKIKMEHWEQFFITASDLPTAISNAILKDIRRIISNCEQRITEINDLVSSSDSAYAEMSTVSQAQELLGTLQELLDYDLPSEKTTLIKQRIVDIQNSFDYLQTIPEKIDDLNSLLKKLEKDQNSPVQRVILTGVSEKLESLLQKQTKWVDQYIIPVLEKAKKLTAPLCIKWINDTKDLPPYLDTITIQKYQEAYVLVEKQLHACRINGVISMYLELTPEEQQEFLRLIKSQ